MSYVWSYFGSFTLDLNEGRGVTVDYCFLPWRGYLRLTQNNFCANVRDAYTYFLPYIDSKTISIFRAVTVISSTSISCRTVKSLCLTSGMFMPFFLDMQKDSENIYQGIFPHKVCKYTFPLLVPCSYICY